MVFQELTLVIYQEIYAHELGFILHQDYWGQGLATKIGNFWLTYAQNHLKLSKLVATVNPTNKASRNVLEKIGLNFISTFTAPERGERFLYSKVVNS